MLECRDFFVSECISLCNDRDQINFGVEFAHNFDIQRLQRMACRLNEVDTRVDPIIHNIHSVHFVLGIEIGVEALLYVLNNCFPGTIIVDKIPKTRGVHDGQPEANTILFNVGVDRLNLDSLGNNVETWGLSLLGRVKGGVEKGVDKSGFSESRFTFGESVISGILGPCLRYLPTTMTLKLNPLRTLLRCHWFGRFANPTYPVNFLRTMFLISLAACAAILGSLEATVSGIAPKSMLESSYAKRILQERACHSEIVRAEQERLGPAVTPPVHSMLIICSQHINFNMTGSLRALKRHVVAFVVRVTPLRYRRFRGKV